MGAGNAGREAFTPNLFVDMATSMEQGYDYMMLEDGSW